MNRRLNTEGMVSIIIPVREKKEYIKPFFLSLFKSFRKHLDNFEVIISENSKDEEAHKGLKDMLIEDKLIGRETVLIRTPFSEGVRGAVINGVRKSKGDYICIVCADLSDRIQDINLMKEKLLRDKSDVVIGNRNHSLRMGRNNWYSLNSFLSFFGSLLIRRFINIKVHDLTNSFRLYRRRVLCDVLKEHFISVGREFSYEVLLKLIRKNCNITEVDTVWKSRMIGVSNFNYCDIFSYLFLTLKYDYQILTGSGKAGINVKRLIE
jgi:glycosyltransferase involved in cell wall biosynthesis